MTRKSRLNGPSRQVLSEGDKPVLMHPAARCGFGFRGIRDPPSGPWFLKDQVPCDLVEIDHRRGDPKVDNLLADVEVCHVGLLSAAPAARGGYAVIRREAARHQWRCLHILSPSLPDPLRLAVAPRICSEGRASRYIRNLVSASFWSLLSNLGVSHLEGVALFKELLHLSLVDPDPLSLEPFRPSPVARHALVVGVNPAVHSEGCLCGFLCHGLVLRRFRVPCFSLVY